MGLARAAVISAYKSLVCEEIEAQEDAYSCRKQRTSSRFRELLQSVGRFGPSQVGAEAKSGNGTLVKHSSQLVWCCRNIQCMPTFRDQQNVVWYDRELVKLSIHCQQNVFH